MTSAWFDRSKAIFAAVTCAVAMSAGAGAQKASGPTNPACALLSVEEIKTATGLPGYRNPSPGDPAGRGAGGGASCQYSAPALPETGPLLSIVLIDGKNYTKTVPIGRTCKKEPAAGVGDEAFFEVCPAGRLSRTPPLYVKAGSKDLILQMDIESPETDATMRPKVIAVAKAAARKLR